MKTAFTFFSLILIAGFATAADLDYTVSPKSRGSHHQTQQKRNALKDAARRAKNKHGQQNTLAASTKVELLAQSTKASRARRGKN